MAYIIDNIYILDLALDPPWTICVRPRGLPAEAGRGIGTTSLYYIYPRCIIGFVTRTKYAKNAGAVFTLKYHLVWCPKYRRPVLEGAVATRLKSLLETKATELEAKIHALEVMPDHIHMFVESDPTQAPARIAAQFKGYTSNVLRREFPQLRSRLPTLWSRSYFIASVGSVTEVAIQHYIESQKGK